MEIKDEKQFSEATTKGLSIVHFWAAWCGPCFDLDKICLKFCSQYKNVEYIKVIVELCDFRLKQKVFQISQKSTMSLQFQLLFYFNKEKFLQPLKVLMLQFYFKKLKNLLEK
jgi:thiol-disulfide isomerase/thioredoxin